MCDSVTLSDEPILSNRHNFLFIHVPKTAGNALQSVLSKHSEDELYREHAHQDGVERFSLRNPEHGLRKHATLAEYRAALGSRRFSGLYKFACVRNPWERAISHFFSPHRGEVSWDRGEFLFFLKQVHPLRHFLGLPFDWLRGRSWNGNVNRILRHERLEDDFRIACGESGIPFEPLPFRNRGAHGPYGQYYDSVTRDAVARRFRDEIDLFGYRFET